MSSPLQGDCTPCQFCGPRECYDEYGSSVRGRHNRGRSNSMRRASAAANRDELRPEYDLSQLKGGVRGKYYKQAKGGDEPGPNRAGSCSGIPRRGIGKSCPEAAGLRCARRNVRLPRGPASQKTAEGSYCQQGSPGSEPLKRRRGHPLPSGEGSFTSHPCQANFRAADLKS
jgi:hypothetical protein